MNHWHLPSAVASQAGLGSHGAGAVRMPALDAGAVHQVWSALDAASVTWRARPRATRIAILAAALAALRDAGPGEWLADLSSTTGLSPAGVRAAWDVTFAPYDNAALQRVVEVEELGDVLDASAAILPRRLVHVVAGNVLAPTLSMLVRGWLLGAAQWLRPSAREPLFAVALATQLQRDAPELAATFAVSWWPHDDAVIEPAVLAAADVVTVQGDDASVMAVAARVAASAAHARVVGFGARWSMGLVARAAQTTATAAGLAQDVALFDQQGCLSPVVVFAEEGPDLEEWCVGFAAALADREQHLPRGVPAAPARAALRAWREAMRLGIALGHVQRLWESAHSSAWALALMGRCSFEPGPLDRHVTVVPFATESALQQALSAEHTRLQGVAADLTGWDVERATRLLSWLRPTRIAPPGTLQLAPPEWRQDHHRPLRSLLRTE